MNTKDLVGKVAALFNLKQQLICLSFSFRPQREAEDMKIEIEEGDEDSFQHALKVLPNYSRITVEVKVERMKEVRLEENRRRARSKEVVSEEINVQWESTLTKGKVKKAFVMQNGHTNAIA